MSKLSSQEKYEKAKAKQKVIALEKEKMIQQDLDTIRREYIPKQIKKKLITGCGIFGAVYLAEELIFKKKIPGVVKFMGALAATAMTPKIFSLIQENFLIIGEASSLGEFSSLPPEPEGVVEEEIVVVEEETIPEVDPVKTSDELPNQPPKEL